jgi:hypothetical protein
MAGRDRQADGPAEAVPKEIRSCDATLSEHGDDVNGASGR